MDHILKENISSIELKYGNIERKSRYLSHVLMRPPIPPQEDALYVRKSSESDLKMEATNDMEAMSPSSDVCKNSQIGDFLDVKNEDDTEMVLNTTYESGAKADTIFAGTEVSYVRKCQLGTFKSRLILRQHVKQNNISLSIEDAKKCYLRFQPKVLS